MKMLIETEVKLPLEITAFSSSVLVDDAESDQHHPYPFRVALDIRGGRFGEAERELRVLWDAGGYDCSFDDFLDWYEKSRDENGRLVGSLVIKTKASDTDSYREQLRDAVEAGA